MKRVCIFSLLRYYVYTSGATTKPKMAIKSRTVRSIYVTRARVYERNQYLAFNANIIFVQQSNSVTAAPFRGATFSRRPHIYGTTTIRGSARMLASEFSKALPNSSAFAYVNIEGWLGSAEVGSLIEPPYRLTLNIPLQIYSRIQALSPGWLVRSAFEKERKK